MHCLSSCGLCPNNPTSSLTPVLHTQACINTVEEAVASCQLIGYPIMLKASWGGGGKGIRKVREPAE